MPQEARLAQSMYPETPDQRDMRRALSAVLDDQSPPESVRAAAESASGWDQSLWRSLNDLGFPALPVPEENDGLGLGAAEAAIAWRETGRRLVPGPLTTTLVAGLVLSPLADGETLTRIAQGAAVGLVDGFGAHPGAGPGLSVRAGRIHGLARQVIHGDGADVLLAACPDGLYVLPNDAVGLTRTACPTMDQTRRLADCRFEGAPARRVGDRAAAERMCDLLLLALAVEAASAAERVLEITVQHLLVRHQFGRPIGSFQALKHRCADRLVAVRGANATAASAIAGASTQDLAVLAPLAKLVAADTLFATAADAIQLFGGIGITWEAEPHMYLKRGKSVQWLACPQPVLRSRLRRAAGIAGGSESSDRQASR